jgi:hypothetical protein
MRKETISELNEVGAYYDGMREGIRAYAHWRDGVQYVGTCGKTLKEALQYIEAEEEAHLTRINDSDKT